MWNPQISFRKSTSDNLSLCGKLTIKNPSSQTANSFLLTTKVCSGKVAYFYGDKDTDTLTRTIIQDTADEKSLFIGKKIAISGGKSYTIGVCIYAEDNDGIDEKSDLIFGGDLSDDANLACSGSDCELSCGNGVCSQEEDASSCPIDCLRNPCVKTEKKTFRRKGLADGVNVWPGSVLVQLTSNKTGEICANLFVSHSNDLIAVSYILTMQILTKKANVVYFSGTNNDVIGAASSIATYRKVVDEVRYQKNTDYVIGALCLNPREGFDLNKDLRFGVDMKDQLSKCSVKECMVVCGDAVCNKTVEDAKKCPVDCDPLKKKKL